MDPTREDRRLTRSATPTKPGAEPLAASVRALRRLLFGDGATADLPPATELASALTSLARGHRRKALVPHPLSPLEVAFVREANDVLVSCYGTGASVDVHVLHRRVDLGEALRASSSATLEHARLEPDPTCRQIAVRIAERAMRCDLETEAPDVEPAVTCRGGATDEPGPRVPLAFGFEVTIRPEATRAAEASGANGAASRSARADVHALLFEGVLWAYVRRRRVVLCRGPVMLAVHRMVTAVQALVHAAEVGRPVHTRLRAGSFHVGVRLAADGEASVTFGAEGGRTVTAAALDVSSAALPILRLASDLLRAFVAVDRSQSKNLRVRALRDEVRRLRRSLRGTRAPERLPVEPEAVDVEVLRDAAARAAVPRSAPSRVSPAARLRFAERWRLGIDGLDAGATFLCGDRLVVATPQHTVALRRDDGEVLWARSGGGATVLMAGSAMVRVFAEGDVELCDVEDGEPYAFAQIAPRLGAPLALLAGGRSFPPLLVLAEGRDRLVGVDVRTGELRWRFGHRANGPLELVRAGRVLIVATRSGTMHALDMATGEVAWSTTLDAEVVQRPAITHDVIAVAVQRDRESSILGLDLFMGGRRFEHALRGRAASAPLTLDGCIAVADVQQTERRLVALDVTDGRTRWDVPDPGLALGASALVVDDVFVTNAPSGDLAATEIATGKRRWARALADAVADDVPRTLEPVLRGGALFVPSANVHVVHPKDGRPIADAFPCDLVPDFLRVDERNWIYVAEESGCIAAYAPGPQLQLIRGGLG